METILAELLDLIQPGTTIRTESGDLDLDSSAFKASDDPADNEIFMNRLLLALEAEEREEDALVRRKKKWVDYLGELIDRRRERIDALKLRIRFCLESQTDTTKYSGIYGDAHLRSQAAKYDWTAATTEAISAELKTRGLYDDFATEQRVVQISIDKTGLKKQKIKLDCVPVDESPEPTIVAHTRFYHERKRG